MALGVGELDEAQWPCTTGAVGGQGRQAQQLEVFDGKVGPGLGGGLRGVRLFGWLYGGRGIGHQGISSDTGGRGLGRKAAPFSTNTALSAGFADV